MAETPAKALSTSRTALCSASAVLLAAQLWIVAQWAVASLAATGQEERVRYFLTHLPLGLGNLGAANVTWFSVAVGTVGLVAAAVAARGLHGRRWKLAIGLVAANAILVLWYLFTMM